MLSYFNKLFHVLISCFMCNFPTFKTVPFDVYLSHVPRQQTSCYKLRFCQFWAAYIGSLPSISSLLCQDTLIGPDYSQMSCSLLVFACRRTVVPNVYHPYSIVVFEDYIFWSDWAHKSVIRANKFTGLNQTTIQGNLRKPMDIKLRHPVRQPSGLYLHQLLVVNVLICESLI